MAPATSIVQNRHHRQAVAPPRHSHEPVEVLLVANLLPWKQESHPLVFSALIQTDYYHNDFLFFYKYFPGMTLYTQYMIDNCVSSDTCSEIHTPHMPVPMRYTSQHIEQQDVAVLD